MVADDPTSSEPPGSRIAPGPTRRTATVELIAAADVEHALNSPAANWLAEQAREAIATLGLPGEVRIRLVGDDEMSRTHERYSGIPGTTDILTFDLTDGGSARGEPLDVDLVVCLDEARRQAAERGIPPEREALLYVIHGVLHCVGFDDHDESAAAAMHRREDQILEAIGVGATYATEPSDSGRRGSARS